IPCRGSIGASPGLLQRRTLQRRRGSVGSPHDRRLPDARKPENEWTLRQRNRKLAVYAGRRITHEEVGGDPHRSGKNIVWVRYDLSDRQRVAENDGRRISVARREPACFRNRIREWNRRRMLLRGKTNRISRTLT